MVGFGFAVPLSASRLITPQEEGGGAYSRCYRPLGGVWTDALEQPIGAAYFFQWEVESPHQFRDDNYLYCPLIKKKVTIRLFIL